MVRTATTKANKSNRLKDGESSDESMDSADGESRINESEFDELEDDETGSDEDQDDDDDQQQQYGGQYSSSDGERMLLSFSQFRDEEASEVSFQNTRTSGNGDQGYSEANQANSARLANVPQAASRSGSSATGSGSDSGSDSIFYGNSSAPESIRLPMKRKRGTDGSRSSQDSSDSEAEAQQPDKPAALAKPSRAKAQKRDIVIRQSKRWVGEPTKFQVRQYSSIFDEHVVETEGLFRPQTQYDWSFDGTLPSSSFYAVAADAQGAQSRVETINLPSGSSWTEVEQDLFFSALARHSRWRPDLIAQDINQGIAAFSQATTFQSQMPLPSSRLEPDISSEIAAWPTGKTTAQVTLYLERLQCAAEIPRIKAHLERGIERYPAASQMSDAYVRWEGKVVARLFDAEEAIESRAAYRERLRAQERERLDEEQEDDEMDISDPDEGEGELLDHAQVSLLASLQQQQQKKLTLGLHGGSTQIQLQGYIRTGKEVCAMFQDQERQRSRRKGRGFGRTAWMRFKDNRKGMGFPRTDATAYVRALVVQLIEKGHIFVIEGDDEDDDEDEDEEDALLHLHNGNGKLSDDEKRNAVMHDKPAYLAGRKIFVPATSNDLATEQAHASKSLTSNNRRQKEAAFRESLAQTAEAVRRAQDRAETALMANVQASVSLKELEALFPFLKPQHAKVKQSHGQADTDENEEETAAGSGSDDDERRSAALKYHMNRSVALNYHQQTKRSEIRRLVKAGASGNSILSFKDDSQAGKLESFLKLLDVQILPDVLEWAGPLPASQRCFAVETLLSIFDKLVAFLREICKEAILAADPNMGPISERVRTDLAIHAVLIEH